MRRGFSKSTLYEGMTSVVVPLAGCEVEVPMDPTKGPMAARSLPQWPSDSEVLQLDGSSTHLQPVRGVAGGGQVGEKLWPQMTSTEQTHALHVCAIKNRLARELIEERGSKP